MQGTRVWSLVWEHPTCLRAAKPTTTDVLTSKACAPQQKRRHDDEEPGDCNEEQTLFATARESLHAVTKTHHNQKKKKEKNWEFYKATIIFLSKELFDYLSGVRLC